MPSVPGYPLDKVRLCLVAWPLSSHPTSASSICFWWSWTLLLPTPYPHLHQHADRNKKYFSIEQAGCSFEQCLLFSSAQWCVWGKRLGRARGRHCSTGLWYIKDAVFSPAPHLTSFGVCFMGGNSCFAGFFHVAQLIHFQQPQLHSIFFCYKGWGWGRRYMCLGGMEELWHCKLFLVLPLARL